MPNSCFRVNTQDDSKSLQALINQFLQIGNPFLRGIEKGWRLQRLWEEAGAGRVGHKANHALHGF
jgi:hypothetical protein